jgi:hypothetical protein
MALDDVEYDLRIGRTKFLEWVAQGWMPKPWIKEGGVARWRTSDVLDAIENFPNRDELDVERTRHSGSDSGGTRVTNPWADQRVK